MTKVGDIVRLGARDWAAISAVVLTFSIAVGGAYLRHDRMMVELRQSQIEMLRRIEQVEDSRGSESVRMDDRVRAIELSRFSSADAIAMENRWSVRFESIENHLQRIESMLMGARP